MTNSELKTTFSDIVEVLSRLDSRDDIFYFLRDLLSQNEIKEFSNRFYVAQLLEEKTPYSEIEKLTGMSSTTIARISKFLKGDNGGYKNAISILKSVSDKHHEGHHSG